MIRFLITIFAHTPTTMLSNVLEKLWLYNMITGRKSTFFWKLARHLESFSKPGSRCFCWIRDNTWCYPIMRNTHYWRLSFNMENQGPRSQFTNILEPIIQVLWKCFLLSEFNHSIKSEFCQDSVSVRTCVLNSGLVRLFLFKCEQNIILQMFSYELMNCV